MVWVNLGSERFLPRGKSDRIDKRAEAYYQRIMKTVTVKLPDQAYRALSRSAEQRGVSKSEIIREALSAREAPGQSLYARIEDLVFDDPATPRDLSSHPRHLKGYGSHRSGR